MHAEPGEDSSSAVVAEFFARIGQGKHVVFVSGNFNIVHPGHLRLLQFAKDCGDFLVVGVSNDSAASVKVPAAMRLEGVRAIGIVDCAFLLQERPESLIRKFKPAVVVKGKEFENRHNPERDAVESYGGTLLFSSGEMRFSSLDLLQRELVETNFSTIVKPLDFPKRHDFSFGDLEHVVRRFSELKVVVIGDLIVDEYINCDPLGMSREDPTIVVTPIRQDYFVGGAGIVAAHASGLGAQVQYFGVVGEDPIAAYAEHTLARFGVEAHFVVDESRPTTLKQRFRADGKTLLRVSHLRQHDVRREIAEQLFDQLCAHLEGCKLLIFSDFNYGCLPQSLVDRLVDHCRGRATMMAADSQASSQIGDVSRFKGMSLLTPTEHEARLAVRDYGSGLVVLAEDLRRKANAEQLFITLGAEGMLIHARSNGKNDEFLTDQLPAFNTAPKDVSGAGDSLLACSCLSLAVGANIWQVAYLGSLAAACQVGRVGNSPLSAEELHLELSL
jgi:rfaE bifunctional protein kinase chain/domain